MTESVVNINSVISKPQDAKISIFDRGFLYGDSVYEVTQTYQHCPYMLDQHLERLWFSASQMAMPIRFTPDEIKREIARTLKELKSPQAYLRIILTRGEAEIGLDPTLAVNNNLVIIAKDLPNYPKTWYENGVEIIIADKTQKSPQAIDPNVKSGNYLSNVLAMNEAKKAGAYDAVMLNRANQVAECTTSNIWMVKDGKISTPSMETGILSGLTRKQILELCHSHSIEVYQTILVAEDLLDADEIFLSSTTKRIIPVTTINKQRVGDGTPGQTTKHLISLHNVRVEEQKKRDQELWSAVLKKL